MGGLPVVAATERVHAEVRGTVGCDGKRLEKCRPLTKAEAREICVRIPKTDLHCHLHGCARPDTLKELAAAKGSKLDLTALDVDNRSMRECFEIFSVIHKLVDNQE